MIVKVKRSQNDYGVIAELPRHGKYGDAGFDLTAVSVVTTDRYFEYKTGLHFEIPFGYYGEIVPRSSLSNMDMILSNSVGVIDSGYRGEVTCRFKLTKTNNPKVYNIGDRICQLIIKELPKVDYIWVDELSESARGENGYGSTGI